MQDVGDELGLGPPFDQHGEFGRVVSGARVGVGVEGDFYGRDLFAGGGDLRFYACLDCVLVGGEDVGYGPAGMC